MKKLRKSEAELKKSVPYKKIVQPRIDSSTEAATGGVL